MQAELKYVSIEALLPSADNVRTQHDPAKHAELVASIREHGIITPLVVRPALREDMYEVAAGHRRLRAAHELALSFVPVSVRTMGDRTFREVMLTENLQRVDPDPLDEADAYQAMIDELAYDVPTLATKFGKSETYVRARLVLTRLAGPVRDALHAGRIELGHAVLLARVSEAAQTQLLGERLLSAHAMPRQPFGGATSSDVNDFYDAAAQDGAMVVATDPVKTKVSIGELREAMAETLLPLRCVKWDRDDPTLVVTAGSCTACPKRTGANPTLFEELNADDDRCPDALCYETKTLAWLEARVQAVRSQAPALVCITTKLQRTLKRIGAAPVLRVARDYTDAKPGSRGSVPAIVVESGAYAMADRWEELGALRDVKTVTPDAVTKAAGKAAAGSAAGASAATTWTREMQNAWDVAEERFVLGVMAVVDALMAAPGDPADHRDAVVLNAVRSNGVEAPWDIAQALSTRFGLSDRAVNADGEPGTVSEDLLTARAVLVLAGVLMCDINLPSPYVHNGERRATIWPETGTFDVPVALIDFAATAGVSASAVWTAALTSSAADVVAGAA